jgi:hypothetical protein
MELLEPSKWCAPVVIQAVLSVMTIAVILFYAKLELSRGMTRGLAAFLYMGVSVIVLYIMLYLCKNGMEWASWLLLLLPLILTLFQQ